MQQVINRILTQAINAPSGSNSQPWRFEVSENIITVIAEPEKDHPVFNYRNRGTLIAHGALIENIVIASASAGYTPEVKTFPDDKNQFITARITLAKGHPAQEELASSIAKRTTNRKPYGTTQLSETEREKLRKSYEDLVVVKVNFITEPAMLDAIGGASSVNEIVMFGNRTLHRLFFEELLWSDAAARSGHSGLYVKTMELAPPQKAVIKILKFWPVMQLAKALGLSKKIAKENAKNYASCAAMVGLAVKDEDSAYLTAGRTLERIWLTATSLGLQAHIMTGVLFMHQQLKIDKSIFSNKERELINEAYEIQKNAFGFKENELAVVMRLGHGKEASGFSSKQAPRINFKL